VLNSHPAKIFMGDVGSLGWRALGRDCRLAARVVLRLRALVFHIEALSVILQVASFKLTASGSSAWRRFTMPLSCGLSSPCWSRVSPWWEPFRLVAWR